MVTVAQLGLITFFTFAMDMHVPLDRLTYSVLDSKLYIYTHPDRPAERRPDEKLYNVIVGDADEVISDFITYTAAWDGRQGEHNVARDSASDDRELESNLAPPGWDEGREIVVGQLRLLTAEDMRVCSCDPPCEPPLDRLPAERS